MSIFDEIVGIVGLDAAIECTAQNFDDVTEALFGMPGMGDFLRDVWRTAKREMWQQLMATTGAEHELDYYTTQPGRKS